MKAKQKQFQQGDLILEAIKSIPADATQQNAAKKAVFVEGEGHHVHRATIPSSVQLYVKDGIQYARVSTDTQVEHVTPDGRPGEHDPLNLPAGDYRFGQVREYDYLNEMSRSVVD